MPSRLLKSLKDQVRSKLEHLKRGTCKDFTEYKTLCAEINLLEYTIEELQKEEDEDE